MCVNKRKEIESENVRERFCLCVQVRAREYVCFGWVGFLEKRVQKERGEITHNQVIKDEEN